MSNADVKQIAMMVIGGILTAYALDWLRRQQATR